MSEIKGIVSGQEVDISRVAMLVNGVDKGWEVRTQNGDILWGADRTLTGTDTIPMKGYGLPLKSVHIKGNSQQTGTPTPDAPIMPQFVGVRTANLLDESASSDADATHVNYNKTAPIILTAGQTYTFSCDTTCNGLYIRSATDDSNLASVNNASTLTYTPQVSVGAYCRVWNSNGITNLKPMLNLGSTALPYEPFGYKIPITNAGQTTPVYLGQTQTVRRVKKLVLDGTETWALATQNLFVLFQQATPITDNVSAVCTHFVGTASRSSYSQLYSNQICVRSTGTQIWIRSNDIGSVADFKAYLSAQYAAGTPVTVWYALAEPETGIVNEPLCKIGDYADELNSEDAGVTIPTVRGQNVLTVDTDLPPSEMTITGHIKQMQFIYVTDSDGVYCFDADGVQIIEEV